MSTYGLIWVWERGAWAPWPTPGQYAKHEWKPLSEVAGSIRILAHLLSMKSVTQQVLVEQGAWVRSGSSWKWKAGPPVYGEAGTIGRALSAHVATAATWAAA